MAEVINIPWAEGGGNITISSVGGDVTISSDVNTSVERSQILTFRTNKGSASATLTVTQLGNRVVLRDVNGLTLRDSQTRVLTAKTK